MITLIYPYRNRSVERIKRSLDSLNEQSEDNFKVIFVDYGSESKIAKDVLALVSDYAFLTYRYIYTQYQPWNKSRALNIALREIDTDYCFVADVDMIFSPNFIETLNNEKSLDKATYFQVGFLDNEETKKTQTFSKYKTKFLSTNEATGLTLFPTNKLKELNGFDEFFHFWGAEDTDMHHRLRTLGVKIDYFDKEILMLHQWHQSFLSKTKRDFSKEFVLTDIEHLNHEHKDKNKELRVTKVNLNSWGQTISKSDFEILDNHQIDLQLTNKEKDIDYLINSLLPSKQNEILGLEISNLNNVSFKDILKKLLGKKIQEYYSMNKVNDLLLMQLIAHYRNKNYIYKVSKDAQKITLKIKL